MRKHWRLIWRVLPYLRPYRRLAIGSVVATVVAAVVALAEPWPLAFLIDGVLGRNGKHRPVPSWVTAIAGHSPSRLILFAVLAGLLIALLINGISLLTEYVNTTLSQRMVLRFRSDLVANALRQSVAFHDARSMGDFIARINYESSSIGAIAVALPPLAQSVLTLAGMAFIAYRIDHTLALASLLILPLIYYSIGYYGNRIEPRLRHVRGLEGKSINIVIEAMSMLRVISVFNRAGYEHRRFSAQAEEAVDARIGVTVRQTLFSFVVNMTTAAGIALVIGIGATHVLNGRLSVGELLVVLAYVHSVYTPLSMISHSMASLQEQFIFLAMSLELLDQQPGIHDEPGAVDLPPVRGDVVFDHASFAYDGRTTTLDDISFEVPAGKAVAIVGPTGAGKTTLMSLLSRLCDPRSGRILVDGHDIRHVTLHSLREQISVVLQEPMLFSGTVAENIRYGRLEATDEEVVAAATAANAHQFIQRLPAGYDTLLGENGTSLSGGERQRICVARAFLKDAPILILDEPTSSIDSKTEASILDALEKLMAGRTTFMIAHRLSTLRSVDRILVLEQGELVEEGTHLELMANRGLYRMLHDVQAHHAARYHDEDPEEAEAADPVKPAAVVRAAPNPIALPPRRRRGATALAWTAFGCTVTEVRVDSPDGPIFARVEHDPNAPAEVVRETGNWVTDGMVFYVQNVSDDRPLTFEHTLATVTVGTVRAEPGPGTEAPRRGAKASA